MSLSGQQRKRLQDALIDAFPNTASLEQMLAFELNKNLRAIAGEGSLQEIVFRLIQVAESQGWIEDLVRGAYNSNPGNQRLRIIAGELLSNHWEPPSVPLHNIHPEQSNQPQKILTLAVVLVATMLGFATVELLSKKQPDETQAKYAQLEYFLKTKNWQEADNQTSQLMLNIAKKEKQGYLDYDSINSFSCPDLKKIDQLWVSNSDKYFGFSVQKEIWMQTGNRLGVKPELWNNEDFESYKIFSRAVGWYDDNKIIKTNPSLSPRGSLPKNLAFDNKVSNQGVLFSNCDLSTVTYGAIRRL